MSELDRVPAFGQRWRHFRGDAYTVIALAIVEANPEQVDVIYRGDDGVCWSRPLANFLGDTFDDDGDPFPRFTRLL